MVAAFTNPFAFQKKREAKIGSARGFFFTFFVGTGVVSGLFIAPIFIAACFGGFLVGLVFSALCALLLAMLVGEACARHWDSPQMVGTLDIMIATLGFALGVALVVILLSISPMEPSFFVGAVASLSFVVALPLATFLWLAFRIKVWKVK